LGEPAESDRAEADIEESKEHDIEVDEDAPLKSK